MNERPFKFSILQLIGITAAVGGIIALYRVLVSPPIGISGLAYALLPGAVVVAGLWIGVRGFQRRMAVYAVVGTLLSMLFLAKYLSKTDLMFGHYRGPLQYEIASAILAGAALVANIGWWIGAVSNWLRTKSPEATDARPSRKRTIAGAVAMALLLVLTAFIAWGSGTDMPRAMTRLDEDVQRRVLQEPRPVREWAELIARTDKPVRREMAMKMQSHGLDPADVAALPTLANLLADHDQEVRRAAAITLQNVAQFSYRDAAKSGDVIAANPVIAERLATALNDEDALTRQFVAKAIRALPFMPLSSFAKVPKTAVLALSAATARPEVEVRATAVTILGAMGNYAAEAVPTLIALVDNPDSGCIMPALQALGQIDAEAKSIVPFLADKVTNSPTPSVRSMASRSLGDLGPAAKDAVTAFKTAWDKRWLTIEDAQAIYEIDPATAEEMRIPKGPAVPLRPPILGSGPPR